MENIIERKFTELIQKFIMEIILVGIRSRASESDQYLANIPGFLLSPKTITVHWFRDHLALSYEGNESSKDLDSAPSPEFIHRFHLNEVNTYLFSSVLEVDLPKIMEDNPLNSEINLATISSAPRGLLFCDSTFSELLDKGWQMGVSNSSGVILNFSESAIPKNKFYNFQNVFISTRSANQDIATHRIKWLDVIPHDLILNPQGKLTNIRASPSVLEQLLNIYGLKKYFIPATYQQKKLDIINKFVELWGNNLTKEIDITRFLEKDEHKFLITMHFGARNIYPEKSCPKLENQTKSIRPDFFVEKTNNTCDIVEFKLPRVSSSLIVGKPNQRRFSAWFSAYLGQAEAYMEHFKDARHRDDAKARHDIVVEFPSVTIVIGRRHDINNFEMRSLLSRRNRINVISYDELIDGVVAQLYM